MRWYTWILCIFGGLLTLAVAVLSAMQTLDEETWKEIGKVLNWFIEFYLSLIAYFVLHLLIVTSSDFVDAFNIPPLNIGIYVDKLAAIRALLMVIADILEWGFLDKALKGSNFALMQQPLYGFGSGWDWKKGEARTFNGKEYAPDNPRRIGSILSFLAMLVCRIVYLRLVYKSDNKSLPVFIVLCIEGFWFGVFQMSFFAIGPQYNAVTSLGIHTMGNFIFFSQLIMQRRAKTHPEINPLYRVRVNAWICVITSVSAFFVWFGFCLGASGEEDNKALAEKWKGRLDSTTDSNESSATGGTMVQDYDVLSPFLLFIVGAFAEDFSVPGILPFALLDTDLAALVNYLTPVFFMTGALVTVLANDGIKSSHFKDWSISVSASAGANTGEEGKWWHAVWLLNIPKYIAFFISMWCIHGTYPRLRCIVQCRWRVMLLTMFVVIPRATLETMGYVGVANYALARAAISSHWLKNKTSNSGTVESRTATTASKNDFGGFVYIAFHDMIAMFCRFVYGKFRD